MIGLRKFLEGSARSITSFVLHRKFPAVVKQYERTDCGPAVLLTVLRYYGGNGSVPFIRQLANTDTNGTTLLNLIRAAAALGLPAKAVTGSYEQFVAEQKPAVAVFTGDSRLDHYVVVFQMNAHAVVIGDPTEGIRTLSREEFEQSWRRRIAVLFTAPTRPAVLKPAPDWGRWLWAEFLRKRNLRLGSVVGLALAETAMGMAVALFVRVLLDSLVPQGNQRAILWVGGTVLLVQLVRTISSFNRRRFLLHLSRDVGSEVHLGFVQALHRLPIRELGLRPVGDLTSRLHDVARVQGAVVSLFTNGIVDGFVLVGSLVALLFLSPVAAGIGFCAAAVCGLLVAGMGRRLQQQYQRVASAQSQAESALIDTIGGLPDILVFGGAQWSARTMTDLFRAFQDRVVDMSQTQIRVSMLAEAFSSSLLVVSLAVGATMAVRGETALGEMMAAYALLASVIPAAIRLADLGQVVQSLSVSANRLIDLIESQDHSQSGSRPLLLQRSLDIHELTFSWNKSSPVLQKASLSIRRGEITGLMGPTGSGKSTLVSLMRAINTPDSGVLSVDGVAYDELDLSSIRKNVAVVPGAVKIFRGTLADNILVGRARTAQELIDALTAAGLSQFVHRFPGGLATLLGDEAHKASLGEQQLIGLMRAMVDPPALLILDEGVAAMDPSLRDEVLDIVRAYAVGHAVLLISHDNDVLLRSDIVYAINRGVISVVHATQRSDVLTRVPAEYTPSTVHTQE